MTADEVRDAIDRIVGSGSAVAFTQSAAIIPEAVRDVLHELNIPLTEDEHMEPGKVFFMRNPWAHGPWPLPAEEQL